MPLGIFLATAVLLGMRHALDPDHLVAVSTLAAHERRLWPAARLGLIWGIGHFLPLALLGLPALLLDLRLPVWMELAVDLAVGAILVLLGAQTLWRLHRERTHRLLHHHRLPRFAAGSRRGWLTLAVGMVHGLAGTGAAALLALSAAPSAAAGASYLLAFGVGTCAGMFGVTLGVAAPALAVTARMGGSHGVLRVLTGTASIATGVVMCLGIGTELLL
ncbi:MAG TPA: sulfite exporter TauE/SafE family protein [Symbiobacteriaceae bacterium]|nr:sulfite exporter TauE/SafE family protein [Symbiobacteriaceae bacterium]